MYKTKKHFSSFGIPKTSLVLGLSAVLAFPYNGYAETVKAEITATQAAQQDRQVKGNIIDEFGDPMIGVTVRVKGTQTATVTDLDGNFTIKAQPSDQLEISYIGYLTKTLSASNAQVNIALEPDNNTLEEVVVIGFGIVKKRDLTGSVSSVKAKDIVAVPTTSIASAMQGRVTGLDVNGSDLRIRGNRSINGSNAPLVIIDGVQGGSMDDVNPNDVESIDVLKDASSTAIYGSQGANGVIIITTKKAEAGRMQVSYDGYVTAAFRPDRADYRSPEDFLATRRLAAQNAGLWHSEGDDAALFGDNETYAAYKAGVWTDYEDLLQKSTTWSTKHTLTLSGGTEKTTARFSLGYANNGSKWKLNGGQDRYTLRANIDHKVHKWISAGVNFQLAHTRNESSPYERANTTGLELGSPYGYLDAESGEYLIGSELVERPLSPSGYVNPLIDAENDNLYKAESYSTNVVANVYLDFHPIEGLTLRSQFNTHLTNHSNGNYFDANASANIEATGVKSSASMTKSSGTYVEWNNILTYNMKLPKEHNLGFTLLTSWNKKMSDNLTATSLGQALASNLWWNINSNDGADGSLYHSSAYSQEQNFSYAARVSYDWKHRYLFTASLRRDGASRLADGNKWDWFPSAALAWRISDEAFMEKTKSWLDDLKLRATYGVTGNAGIGVYGTQSGVSFASTAFGFQDTAANRYVLGVPDNNGSGYYVLANKNTSWEKSTTIDLGFDAVLFDQRVNVTFDWYYTKTTDILLLRSLPTSAGMDGKYAVYTNIGATKNKGFELSINSRNIETKDFSWSSTLSFSANNEEITELYDGNEEIQVGTDFETQTLMTGHPIKSFKTFTYDGIWSSADEAQAAVWGMQPGDIRVAVPGGVWENNNGEYRFYKTSEDTQDENGNVVHKYYTKDNPYSINQSGDVGYVGSTSPDWFAGFNNDFRYKNWDFNFYLYARWGHWGESRIASFDPSSGGSTTNYDFWVKGTNEGGSLPALYKGRKLYDYTGYQSLWFCDQSFIKLKRVTVGYTLPKSVLAKAGISNVRLYCTVNDPLYFVKEDWQKNYDPEGNQRSVTFGLNVNF